MILGTKKTLALVFSAALLALVGAAPAHAGSTAIYQACSTGGSMEGFSKSDLQSALSGVPADLEEYYSCSAQINAALVAKVTKSNPGSTGAAGVKGTRAALRAASAEELTTPAERERIAERVGDKLADLGSKPPTATTDPSVPTAAGSAVAGTTAAGAPTALIIGVIGLLLLFSLDLFRRLGRNPRVAKILPWSAQSGGD